MSVFVHVAGFAFGARIQYIVGVFNVAGWSFGMTQRRRTLRVLTLNIWQEQGPWSDSIGVIERELLWLKPDLVCLQEVREVASSIPNQAQTLAEATGMAFCYETAQAWGGGDEGIAVLSRFPIEAKACERLPTHDGRSGRVCVGVQVIPNDEPVWCFSTHLAYRLTDTALRMEQVVAVSDFIAKCRGTGPRQPLAVLAGDFNAIPSSDPIRFLRGERVEAGRSTYFQDAWTSCRGAEPGPTWCRDNPYTNALSHFPLDRRLDYLFVSPERRGGHGRILSCDRVCMRPNAEGVYASDHYGVLAEIELV